MIAALHAPSLHFPSSFPPFSLILLSQSIHFWPPRINNIVIMPHCLAEMSKSIVKGIEFLSLLVLLRRFPKVLVLVLGRNFGIGHLCFDECECELNSDFQFRANQ